MNKLTVNDNVGLMVTVVEWWLLFRVFSSWRSLSSSSSQFAAFVRTCTQSATFGYYRYLPLFRCLLTVTPRWLTVTANRISVHWIKGEFKYLRQSRKPKALPTSLRNLLIRGEFFTWSQSSLIIPRSSLSTMYVLWLVFYSHWDKYRVL